MNKIKKLLMACLAAVAITSCKAPDDVVYLQDLEPGTSIPVQQVSLVTVKPTDKLVINVNSRDETIAALFNIRNMSYGSGSGGNSGGGNTQQDLTAYTVDNNGNINFPVVGPIHVAGLTRQGVADHVREVLVEQDLIKDPYVTCAFANFGFYAVGEVAHPGRNYIIKDEINILEALATAGDLTFTGDRTNIQIFRQKDGHLFTYEVDLTDAQSIISSPVFYIQPEDIIYVHPTKKKQFEATTMGNTTRTPNFWISLVSSLLSLGVAVYAIIR